MDIGVTSQLLTDTKNNKKAQDKSKDIIGVLVKQQQSMEKTLISKMDRDFEMKSEEFTTSIETMLATVEDQLEKIRNSCNTQLTKIHDKQ